MTTTSKPEGRQGTQPGQAPAGMRWRPRHCVIFTGPLRTPSASPATGPDPHSAIVAPIRPHCCHRRPPQECVPDPARDTGGVLRAGCGHWNSRSGRQLADEVVRACVSPCWLSPRGKRQNDPPRCPPQSCPRCADCCRPFQNSPPASSGRASRKALLPPVGGVMGDPSCWRLRGKGNTEAPGSPLSPCPCAPQEEAGSRKRHAISRLIEIKRRRPRLRPPSTVGGGVWGAWGRGSVTHAVPEKSCRGGSEGLEFLTPFSPWLYKVLFSKRPAVP